MWNPIEKFKQQQARRRFMPAGRRPTAATTRKAAIIALVLILSATAALQMRGGSTAAEDFAAAFARDAVPALDIVERAAASRRLVFLADVPSASSPKRLAADAIEKIAEGSGLDVVALEIDAAEQPFIDRYLATPSEDASIILSRPRITHESEGVSSAYVEVLRAVRRMNDKLGADRHIRIVAIDTEGWPPAGAVSPSEAAQQFGDRDTQMARTLQSILESDPKTRVLFFVGGFHAMKSGTGIVQTGGTRTVEITSLAARLLQSYPQDVYSILVDATPSRIPVATVAAYRGTAAGAILRDAGAKSGTGMTTGPAFDFVRNPIDVVEKPGIHFDLTPHDLTMQQIADAYIYLGS